MGLNQPRCHAGSINLHWLMMCETLSDETHVYICGSLLKETIHMERSYRGPVVNVPRSQ